MLDKQTLEDERQVAERQGKICKSRKGKHGYRWKEVCTAGQRRVEKALLWDVKPVRKLLCMKIRDFNPFSSFHRPYLQLSI
jgi:hypothetical protein